MNAMNEVAAVVVTYNRKDLLLQNIECLRNQKDKSCDIFIIDNASTDGTQEAVASIADSRIHYINTGSNLGGAGGFEFGVKEAVEAGYEYIWIMDDDTLPYDDALKELLNADKELNGKWGALSSRPYWSDGSTCKANRQKKTIFSFVSDKEYDEGKHIIVTMASFVSLLVKTKIIKELGLPIGEYFIWTDDYEFTGRISKKYPIYVVPKSRVLHAMKENKKICFARETPDRIERYNYVYRNDVHCYRQFGFTGWIYILLKAAYTTLDIWRYSDGDRWKKIKILWGGSRRHKVPSTDQTDTITKNNTEGYTGKQRCDTVAVVVTYNRKELLQKNLNCLSRQTHPCDVLVIDNASTDGTGGLIELERENITYFNTGKNLGGAGGFEIGVKKAVESGYQYVWIMDDDTLPNEDALEKLFEANQNLNGNWGWLSSLAYWTDGSICRMNIQKKDIFRHIGQKEYEQDIVPVKMCSFVSLLVKSAVVREVGCPIGEYFIWTDDYEFTGRISRKYPCYMVPGSKVIHAMKSHMRVNFAHDSPDRMARYRYIYRNDVHCYRQYGLKGWAYIISKDLYTAVDVLRHSKENKKEKLEIMWNGAREGLAFHPKIKEAGRTDQDK